MNERIKELAKRAGYLPDSFGIGHWDMPEFKEFSRLMVEECMELCKKQEYDYWRSSEDQDFTPIDCADRIKQHFGVKE